MSARTNSAVRERSGKVNSDDALVGFIYLLLRDHLPAGVVEKIATDVTDKATRGFTNGWLAAYAVDLAKSLSSNNAG